MNPRKGSAGLSNASSRSGPPSGEIISHVLERAGADGTSGASLMLVRPAVSDVTLLSGGPDWRFADDRALSDIVRRKLRG
jgi:hypothetical protein